MIALITTADFMNRYLSHLHSSKSNKEAWEKTEDEWKTIHGRFKYSSFESFKTIKTRFYKINK